MTDRATLDIVIPMAGAGRRFAEAGYRDPKPLIPLDGVPLIRLVIENLRPRTPHRFIFVCQAAHLDSYDLERRLRGWVPSCEVVATDGLTGGALCTVLLARDLLGRAPVMVANSDQFVDIDIDGYLAAAAAPSLDGLIMTMPASDPKWSFAAVDGSGLVTEVAEKRPISDHATVGIYSFSDPAAFLGAADRMISRGERVNGEFYVAPVYNELIAQGGRIGIHDIGERMHGLGIPADLIAARETPALQAAVRRAAAAGAGA